MGLAYSFRGLVHYYDGRKNDNLQADMVPGRQLRVLHLDPLIAGNNSDQASLARLQFLGPQSSGLSDVTDLLLQSHTYSKKAL